MRLYHLQYKSFDDYYSLFDPSQINIDEDSQINTDSVKVINTENVKVINTDSVKVIKKKRKLKKQNKKSKSR